VYSSDVDGKHLHEEILDCKMVVSSRSGAGGGGVGVQAHPRKLWFVENPGKIPENLRKIPEKPGKIPKNLEKFPENTGKNNVQRCLSSKTGAHNLCRKIREGLFYGRSHQKEVFMIFVRENLWAKSHTNFLDKFGKIREKILRTPKSWPGPTPMSSRAT